MNTRSFRLFLLSISLFLIVFYPPFPTQAQMSDCRSCRYTSSIFDSITVETVQYGKGENVDGQMQDLKMDIYRPHGDTASHRPVFIFAFGGGFVQGSKEDDYVVRICRKVAETGYVAAAIDYRTGIDFASGVLGPVEEFMRVFFRPMQDMRGAIQYFKAHADSMGNSYRIDTNNIIIGGGSAGAITALNVAYADSAEFAEIGDMSAIDELGSFRSTTGFHKDYNWDDVAGVFNVAGAMVEAEWLEAGDPPLVSAHGDEDNTVPYKGGVLDLGFGKIGLEGSYLIDSVAEERNVCSYLYTLEGVGHPSGSTASLFINEFVNRAIPRMQAIVEDQSFCCDLGVNITPSANDTVEQGDTVHLIATTVNDTGNADLHWCSTPCDFYSDSAAITVQPTPPNFYLAVADQGNCQASNFVTMFEQAPPDTTGILPQPSAIGISIYPNPASDQLQVTIQNRENNLQIKLLDVMGRTLKQTALAQGQARQQLHVGNVPEGVYFIQITQQQTIKATRKVMIR
jgi:acetyl esterase/lipase